MKKGLLVVLGSAALFFTGCRQVDLLRDAIRPASPHEQYEQALEQAGLSESALGRAWIAAAESSLKNPAHAELPFREAVYFASDEANAAAYRIAARRGHRLVVDVEVHGESPLEIFVDLFQTFPDTARAPRRVASAESLTEQLQFETDDAVYLLRLQPELLATGRFIVTIQALPSMNFPVAGVDGGSIRSFFGDSRDGGRRKHHGVDIFAERGTPVLSATSGIVTSVRTGGIGGKVVWVHDLARGKRVYYAHLDTQLVAPGTRVSPGDTIGLVGNTGNARTTPPHLHFGVYRGGSGPLDPHPFIYASSSPLPDVPQDLSEVGKWYRIKAERVNLRRGPGIRSEPITTLSLHTALLVIGASGGWYRVRVPDGSVGFVSAALTEPADSPIANQALTARTALRRAPFEASVVADSLDRGTSVSVLGRFNDYVLVETPAGQRFWSPGG